MGGIRAGREYVWQWGARGVVGFNSKTAKGQMCTVMSV